MPHIKSSKLCWKKVQLVSAVSTNSQFLGMKTGQLWGLWLDTIRIKVDGFASLLVTSYHIRRESKFTWKANDAITDVQQTDQHDQAQDSQDEARDEKTGRSKDGDFLASPRNRTRYRSPQVVVIFLGSLT